MSPAQRIETAEGGGATSPHWAGGDRRRQARTNEFIDYLWGAARPPEVLFRGPAVRDRLPGERPGGGSGGAPTAPGSIHLYRRFLLFLGEPAGLEQGGAAGGSGLVRLGSAAYSRLSVRDRNRLREPLLREDSLIVPLSAISQVRSGHWGGLPCLEVETRDGTVRIGPDPAGSATSGATRWEPRLQQALDALIDTGGG